jgi:hypothetical protein
MKAARSGLSPPTACVARAPRAIFLGLGQLAQGFDRHRGFDVHTRQCFAAIMVQLWT